MADPVSSAGVSAKARASTYTLDAPDGYEHESITVVQTGKLSNGRFDPVADVWAVRKRGWCLSADGDWEYEPLPSLRDEAFLATHRWPLVEALERAAEALERETSHDGTRDDPC